jgi:pimeloyl-ACP methyl ester carboxylesterase
MRVGMVKAISVLGVLAYLASCASPATRIDARAESAGLSREVAQGTHFRHVVYTLGTATDSTWTVYVEGDGLPWVNGRTPAPDPTTRNAVALELMIGAGEPAMYVSRPCYQALADPACSWKLWTMARYAPAVIDSMASTIAARSRAAGAGRIRLVGYSGGGSLAVLIAERLEHVDEVITLAANLDTEAWTKHHGYLPLTDSLNPARADAPSHQWREVHLQGAKDAVVPPATTHAYFERHPNARRITVPGYDHVCCWARDWHDLNGKLRINDNEPMTTQSWPARASSAVSGKSVKTPSTPSSKN